MPLILGRLAVTEASTGNVVKLLEIPIFPAADEAARRVRENFGHHLRARLTFTADGRYLVAETLGAGIVWSVAGWKLEKWRWTEDSPFHGSFNATNRRLFPSVQGQVTYVSRQKFGETASFKLWNFLTGDLRVMEWALPKEEKEEVPNTRRRRRSRGSDKIPPTTVDIEAVLAPDLRMALVSRSLPDQKEAVGIEIVDLARKASARLLNLGTSTKSPLPLFVFSHDSQHFAAIDGEGRLRVYATSDIISRDPDDKK